MKKFIYSALFLATTSACLLSCSNDEPDKTSIITVGQTVQTPLDKWLKANYVDPYNIRFKYRYVDNEGDMNYFTIPAKYEDAVKMAHLIKYLCIEAYDEVGGVGFTRSVFPKLIYCIGEFEYRNNGTIILGTAENGKKILMTGSNYITTYEHDIEQLNHFYFKTIHHEFTHILNQNKDYPAAFKLITGSAYVSDSWSTHPYDGYNTDRDKNNGVANNYCYLHGFITPYSQHSDVEDIAELLSTYVVNTKAEWDRMVALGGTNGGALITSKMDIVKRYMKTAWNIDLDALRDVVQRRQADVAAGKIDITDLTVK